MAVLVCGRFFYYVAKDARISNTPPNSELEGETLKKYGYNLFIFSFPLPIQERALSPIFFMGNKRINNIREVVCNAGDMVVVIYLLFFYVPFHSVVIFSYFPFLFEFFIEG